MQGTVNTRGEAKEAKEAQEAKPRPQRRWLVYSLQALWIANAVLVVYLLLFSLRPGYALLSIPCNEVSCNGMQLTFDGLESITALDISIQSYAFYQLAFIYTIALIYLVVSFIIFRARPNDAFALYVALVLLNFGIFLTTFSDIFKTVAPWLTILLDIVPGVTLIAFAILCYLFPDGRFVPRWTRWAAVTWVAIPIVLIISVFTSQYETVYVLLGIFMLGLFATCIISPIYRYRTHSSRTQRQQLKWALFGIIQLALMILFIVELLPRAFPQFDNTGTLPNLLSAIVQSISLAIFPLTMAIALLRYRLWDVDLVINRTLVYVPLTSILTVIYSTSMAISQRLFTSATGEQPQAVAIFTTIVLTSTFSPIKNSLQSYVDNHFKEAPGQLKELKTLDKQVSQIVQALDYRSLAQQIVETIVKAHRAKGAALYLNLYPNEKDGIKLSYSTPNWVWEEGEVSILLYDDHKILGRLLLGPRSDRDDYTLEECQTIHTVTLPIVRNMLKLTRLQDEQRQLEEHVEYEFEQKS